MYPWKKYHLAQSIADALQTLIAAPGPARLIAGGSDLLLDIDQGRHSPVHTLVDVTAIPQLKAIEINGEKLFVGAAVTLNKLVSSPLVYENALALVEACCLIGGPQVRNIATLGGNVAHALPAADGTIALLALGAEAEIADLRGNRTIPLEGMFLGPGQSTIKAQEEILVGFYLPLRKPGQASAFRRVMRPQGVALPILNMAVWMQRQGEAVEDLRIAIGPSGPTPRRAFAAEEALRGQTINPQSLSNAQTSMLEEARFRTSPHRASAAYRRHLAGLLLEDSVLEAWKRAAND